MAELPRFSSCRGVSFEINRNSPPANHNTAPPLPPPWWYWPFSASKVAPDSLSAKYSRTLTRSSSHFCDLDVDEYDVEDHVDHESGLYSLHQIQEEEAAEKQKPTAPTEVPQKQPPAKPESRLSVILLDQGLFTVYKRLFVVCFLLNVAGLVLAATGHFPYAKDEAAVFSVGNILALVLCRNEAFLRCVFWLAVKVLGWSWVPLALKTATTSFLQCLGGIHSGCGVSSIMWLTYSLVETLRRREATSDEIVGLSSAILGLLVLSAAAAFPLVRHLHHNVFERVHRFAGWTALAALWAFVILAASYDPTDHSYRVHCSALVKKQEFWFTVAITILIALPWLCVRRVPVRVSAPSNHASIIKFAGGIKAGILGRISRSPLSEWHAFGIISDGEDEHAMLAGAVGDFTRGLVSDPPKYLWTRCIHFAGLPYLVNMYDKVLLVATGSGICVFLSFMMQPCRADVYFIWVAKGIERNFGEYVVEKIKNYPSEKVIIHDTALLGRPNVTEMTVQAAKKWGAEVVIVTSNPTGSRDVVNGCKDVGIPAFGPIWDS